MKTTSTVQKEEKASSSACNTPTQTSSSSSSSLSLFHEDVILSIISYVADVPFELITPDRSPIDSHSTLTHTLPLVSKQFYKLTRRCDLHWKWALLRLVRNEPLLWEVGMERVIFDARCDEIRAEIGERGRTRRAAATAAPASTTATAGRSRRDKRARDGEQLNRRQEESSTSQSDAVSNNSVTAADEEQSNVNNPTNDDNNTTKPAPSSSSLKKEEQLLQKACTAIQLHPPHHHTATSSGLYQCLYQSILQTHIRYQAPVFIMPSPVRLGETYGLHFFEPRYRILIAEVMANHPISARRGGRISPLIPGLFPLPSSSTTQQQRQQVLDDDIQSKISKLVEDNNNNNNNNNINNNDPSSTIVDNHYHPMFIHAHQAPFQRNVPATIVRVEQCEIQPDGSADVFMTPMAYILLEETWERPGTGGLVEARGVRMGMDWSQSYECWCATPWGRRR